MDSKKRFSNRVENSAKYRPSYPRQAVEYILGKGINSTSSVADMGAGTGIFSRLLVEKSALNT